MRKILGIAAYLLLINIFAGCAGVRSIIKPPGRVGNATVLTPFPAYSGPKAYIVVENFDVKAARAGSEAGSGLREMLVTALLNSKRFSLAEPRSANLIITAALTEFEPQASGGMAGVGGGGGVGNGMLGGLLSPSLNKARMSLNIRISDSVTSEVLASARVQGQASDTPGGFMSGFFGGWGLGSGLSAYANTPMEKAMRICVIEAARYILQTVPKTYYKH